MKKCIKKLATIAMVAAMATSSFSVALANNYTDAEFDYSISAGESKYTPTRRKMDNTSAYMYCTYSSYSAGYSTRLYRGTTACSAAKYFTQGKRRYISNTAYNSTKPLVRFLISPTVTGNGLSVKGKWSPDNVSGYTDDR